MMASDAGGMRINFKYVTPALAAGAAAIAIAAAPTALAAPVPAAQSCSATAAGDDVCQSPGNVQINDTPGPVDFPSEYPYPWVGGYYGGYGGFAHGGFGGFGHGGGGGHR